MQERSTFGQVWNKPEITELEITEILEICSYNFNQSGSAYIYWSEKLLHGHGKGYPIMFHKL